MAPYLAERGLTMNLIDRLIAKAQTIQLALGDDVFMIIREDVGWTVDGQPTSSRIWKRHRDMWKG